MMKSFHLHYVCISYQMLYTLTLPNQYKDKPSLIRCQLPYKTGGAEKYVKLNKNKKITTSAWNS